MVAARGGPLRHGCTLLLVRQISHGCCAPQHGPSRSLGGWHRLRHGWSLGTSACTWKKSRAGLLCRMRVCYLLVPGRRAEQACCVECVCATCLYLEEEQSRPAVLNACVLPACTWKRSRAGLLCWIRVCYLLQAHQAGMCRELP